MSYELIELFVTESMTLFLSCFILYVFFTNLKFLSINSQCNLHFKCAHTFLGIQSRSIFNLNLKFHILEKSVKVK